MKIGIDIDNCISNFDDVLLEEYIKHDKELRNTGIVDENPIYISIGMFDWSKEENDDFYYNNIQRIAMSLKPLNNAKEVIDKLKADGNEIYIITSRDNGEYINPEKMTREWLEKYEIYFDKLILTGRHEKGPVCKENIINIMIEDSIKNCEDIENNGVKCYIMDTRYNKQETRFERVKSWNEIYSKLAKLYKKDEKQERINVILDTDTYNECDDQFALSYMLLSQDRFNIEAITVAPYHHDNNISVEEGQEKSYQEILKICNWLNFNVKNKVFKGSNGYIENGYDETNEAVEKIIAIGYVHDIGKYNGEVHGHVMRGYNYLKEKGYDEDYCNICLTHSYLNNDIICTAGGIPDTNENPFLTNFIKNHEYTKEYFDNLLGYNLYESFPEIKDNL